MTPDPKALLAKYQPKEGKPLKAEYQLCALRFSPCGKVLAAGSFDGTVRRWDSSGADPYPELPPLTGHNGWVQCVAFSPLAPSGRGVGGEGRLFSADSWGRLSCWDYTERESKPLWSVAQAHDGWVRKVVVSLDGQTLATCGADRKVILWSADKGTKRQELAGHDQDVYSLAFHPDGKSLVTGDLKGVVRQFDLASVKKVREFDAKVTYFHERIQDVGGVRCLAFDPTGSILAAAGSEPKSGGFVQGIAVLRFFDWTIGKEKNTVKIGADSDGFVHDLAWHPDGFVMAVTSGQPGIGKFVFLRPEDAAPFFFVAKPNCHALAVHPNGKRLVVAATNANSSGNGRNLGANKEYPGNWSPLLVWDMPAK